MNIWLFSIVACLLLAPSAMTQDQTLPAPESTVQHVIVLKSDESPAAEIVFSDALSGEATTLTVNGERFSLLGDGVIYFDPIESKVKLATPRGTDDHPFIRANADSARIDWVISRDGNRIAWTLAAEHADAGLVTATVIAHADGTNLRQVLADGPRPGIRVLPAGIAPDGDEIYLDIHPDGINGLGPYPRFANLVALNLSEGDEPALRQLTRQPICFCPAAFGAEMMLRLLPNTDAELTDLATGEVRLVPGVSSDGFTIATAPILSDDDSLAVYGLSRIADDGAQTRFVVLDLQRNEQRIVVGEPIGGLVDPIAFTEEKSALLFNRGDGNTWKLRLEDGAMLQVAIGIYLGVIGA